MFNPASFYLCRDASGGLRVVIVEVHNTLRRASPVHAPAAQRATPTTLRRRRWTRTFFVSPFIAMDGAYAVHVRDEPRRLRIAIALRQDGQPLLATSLVLGAGR